MTIDVDKETLIQRASDNGVLMPRLAYNAAELAELPYFAACAFLMQETGGGRNVWGHDDTWMIGYPILDEETYGVYKTHRARFGNQGVGPMQLTSPGFQDAADKIGGCWNPENNLAIAFKYLAGLKADGLTWWEVAKRYNGADSYADQMVERFQQWRAILRGDAK